MTDQQRELIRILAKYYTEAGGHKTYDMLITIGKVWDIDLEDILKCFNHWRLGLDAEEEQSH